MPLPIDERLARLQLSWTENVGPITFRQLLNRFGSAKKAIGSLPEMSVRGGRKKPLTVFSRPAAEECLDAIKKENGSYLVWGDQNYPKLLAAIDDAPPVIALKGHAHLLEKPAIAIIGARNASTLGKNLTYKFANELSDAGYIIVSGLARGIDAEAHRGALDRGTIAVLGTGIDQFYPRENRELQSQIAQQGLLVSEHKIGVKAQASHFPRRNRIISGLSLGILVIEAAPKSGSLITARLALEQGREVMAVPGSPLDPRAKGTNKLIQQGAHLIESTSNILAAIETLKPLNLSEPSIDDFAATFEPKYSDDICKNDRLQVFEKLSPTPVLVDNLIADTGLPTATVLAILLEYELAGKITQHAGNKVALSSFNLG